MEVRPAWARLAAVPFETLIGGFAAYSGIVSLLDYGVAADALDAATPALLATAFNLAFVVAGVALLVGIGGARRKVEAAGLVLIVTSVLVRSLALVALLGFVPITVNSLVLNVFTIAMMVLRLRTVLRGAVLLQIEPRGAP